MGIEHYVVCRECKEYIDLHKAYSFGVLLRVERPPVGIDCAEVGYNDITLRGGYWESRGLWFIWNHRTHGSALELHTDTDDDWFNLKPHLTEKFSHDDDCRIRDRISATKKGPP